MKAFIAAIVLFGSFTASAMTMGDKIHFQKDSTWVSAAYSRSLCLDGDFYEATVSVCTKWDGNSDDRQCVTRGTKEIYQPMVSTRQRCASYNDDKCTSWETVDYIQNRVRTVRFYNNDDDLVGTKTITIPDCK